MCRALIRADHVITPGATGWPRTDEGQIGLTVWTDWDDVVWKPPCVRHDPSNSILWRHDFFDAQDVRGNTGYAVRNVTRRRLTYEQRSKVLLGFKGIVRAAAQLEVLHRRGSPLGKRHDVVEFQTPALRASS